MRKEAFENELKKILDKEKYLPNEASWNKLQNALNTQAQKESTFTQTNDTLKTKSISFGYKQWTAAAAIAGVLMASAVYFINQNTAITISNNKNVVSKSDVKVDNKLAQKIPSNDVIDVPMSENKTIGTVVENETSNRIYINTQQTIVDNANEITKSNVLAIKAVASNIELIQNNPLATFTSVKSIPPLSAKNANNLTSSNENSKKGLFSNADFYYVKDWNEAEEHSTALFEDPFVYGVTVKAGLPKVGAFLFNGGLMIKKEWKKLFTEANIDVSFTDVQYKKAMYYRTNPNGTVDNLGSSLDNKNSLKASGSTTNTYHNNVLGIGMTALAGIQLNKKVAVVLGADLSRNFNNKLILKGETKVNDISMKNTVDPIEWINMWDAGAKAQLRYGITNNVEVLAQYRQGLVNYMQNTEGKTIKNSSVALGVNYIFNP